MVETKIKKKDAEKNKQKKFDDYNEEEFSNYGDELLDSDSDEPKKRKMKIRERNKSKLKKVTIAKQKYPTLMSLMNEQTKTYIYQPEKPKEKTFGKDNRYSLRTRIPRLKHENGERINYVDYGNGWEIAQVELCKYRRGYEDVLGEIRYDIKEENKFKKEKKKKNKKLIKGGGIKNDDNFDKKLKESNSEESDDNDDYNSEKLDSENFSEYGEDDARFIKIPKGGKKKAMKNYGTLLIIKVHEAYGKNMIIVDKLQYKDVKSGRTIRVKKNQIYEILNFSNYDLIVQLLIEDEN
jgi:hypothetical protein